MTASATSQTAPIGAPAVDEDYSLELTGWRLNTARLFWIVAAFANSIAFLAGIPRAWAIAADLSPQSIDALAALGLPPIFPPLYLILLDSATFLFYGVVAVIIFRRKNTERLAIFTSLMLLFTAMLYTAPGYEVRAPVLIAAAGAAFAETFQIAFLLLFPTGRYFPEWSWLTLAPIFLWRWWVWDSMYIPWLYDSVRTGDNYPFLRQEPRDLIILFAVVLVALGFQVRRYRLLASRSQKQQAKWLVWSASMAIVIVGAYVIAINTIPALQPEGESAVLLRLIGRTVRQAALCLIPLAMLRAILRNRLYDIDIVINRSLVYVPLTSVLAGLFGAIASLSQRFFVATTGQNSDAVIIISSVIVTALFQPVRSSIQTFVDNRMKDAPDNFRTLKQFDGEIAAVANALDRRHLFERLLAESIRATDAEGGAVYEMSEGRPLLITATEGWHGPLRLEFPIAFAGESYGWLALGIRKGSEPYGSAERERLAQSAMQTGRLLALLTSLMAHQSSPRPRPTQPELDLNPYPQGVTLSLPLHEDRT